MWPILLISPPESGGQVTLSQIDNVKHENHKKCPRMDYAANDDEESADELEKPINSSFTLLNSLEVSKQQDSQRQSKMIKIGILNSCPFIASNIPEE